MYHRFGHLQDVKVKEGDTVKKGDLIATIGNTGNSTSAHLHYDVSVDYVGLSYVNNWSKEEVKEIYQDPNDFEYPSENDHEGWSWLEWYGSGYHPGIDINGPGAGNADLGQEIYATFDGEVVYAYSNGDFNSGWGNLIIIKETMDKEYHITSDLEKELQKRDKDFDGDKKSDQKDMAEILRDERHDLEALYGQEVVCEFGDYIIIKK